MAPLRCGLRLAPPIGLVVVVLAVAAPTAAASTYCVQDPACPQGGIAENTLADAVQAADTNGVDGDTVRIGSGTFDTDTVIVDTPMEIAGAGTGNTVLRNTGASHALRLRSSSSATDLDVLLTLDGSSGIQTQDGADIRRVRVLGPDTLSAVSGFILVDPGSLVHDVVVDLGSASSGAAIFDQAGGGLILDATLINGVGIQSTGTTATTAKRVIMLTGTGVLIPGGSLDLANAVIAPRSSASASFFGADVSQSSDGTRPGVLDASHLTVVGGGQPGSIGVNARSHPALGLTSGTVDVTVSNSIVRNVQIPLMRNADPFPESVDLTVRYSTYDATKVLNLGGGPINGSYVDTEGNIKDAPDPRFLDPAASNYRLRFDSPLLDVGDPAPPSLSDALDLARLFRLRDSDGNGDKRRDMGAYEYQREPPVPSFSASPLTTLFGDLTTFDATATSDPDGDPITSYEWQFGDGATASGVSVFHGYALPGAYQVTLTARDATGLTGTAQAGATLALRTGACANVQRGGAGADVLTGFAGADLLLGGDGDDRLLGGDGDDCLGGDAGEDQLDGQEGADTLTGGVGNDRLAGQAGADTIYGGSGSDGLAGHAGGDVLLAQGGADGLDGGAGADRLNGGPGRDRVAGGADRDRLEGGGAADRIKAAGGDRVNGGPGNDRIDAANGRRDRVNCGKGRRDRARADRKDRLRGCELVRRVGRSGRP